MPLSRRGLFGTACSLSFAPRRLPRFVPCGTATGQVTRNSAEPMVSSGVPIRAPVRTMRARPAAARVREQASGRTHQY